MPKVLITATVASMIDLFNMNNIEILQNMGYEVHVAANFVNGNVTSNSRLIEFKKELDKKKVKYYNIEFSRDAFDLKTHFQTYKEFLNLCKINDYEFIHTQTPIAGAITRLVAHKLKIKNIYMAHGFHFFKGAPLKNWIIYFPIEKFLSRYTDVLVTINKEDYNSSKKFHAKKNVLVHGVGINTNIKQTDSIILEDLRSSLNILPDDVVFISVGELNDNKNHSVAIEAFKSLEKLNFKYFIVGKGPNYDKLEAAINDNDLNEKIKLLGYRQDIIDLLQVSDVFLFPSYREGLSKDLMEAMSFGLPIVASKIRGNTDLVIENKGGYFFEPSNSEELSSKLLNIYQGEDKRRTFSEFNKKKIKEFDIDKVNNEMTEIFLSM